MHPRGALRVDVEDSVGTYRRSPKIPALQLSQKSSKSASAGSYCCNRVPNRPLRGRRGRFGTLLQLLECGISLAFRTGCSQSRVAHDAPFSGASADA